MHTNLPQAWPRREQSPASGMQHVGCVALEDRLSEPPLLATNIIDELSADGHKLSSYNTPLYKVPDDILLQIFDVAYTVARISGLLWLGDIAAGPAAFFQSCLKAVQTCISAIAQALGMHPCLGRSASSGWCAGGPYCVF